MLVLPLTREELLDLLPKGRRIAEIGVARGEFSTELLARCEPAELSLVDHWLAEPGATVEYGDQAEQDRRHVAVTANFTAEIGAERVRILRQSSAEASATFTDGTLDVVYIDADHSYDGVRGDLETYMPKLAPGGLLMGHDFARHKTFDFRVIEAVEDFARDTGAKVVAMTARDAFPSFVMTNEVVGDCRDLISRLLAEVPGIVDVADYPSRLSYASVHVLDNADGVNLVPRFQTRQ